MYIDIIQEYSRAKEFFKNDKYIYLNLSNNNTILKEEQ